MATPLAPGRRRARGAQQRGQAFTGRGKGGRGRGGGSAEAGRGSESVSEVGGTRTGARVGPRMWNELQQRELDPQAALLHTLVGFLPPFQCDGQGERGGRTTGPRAPKGA